MDWKEPLIVTKSLMLQVDEFGTIVATNSLSQAPFQMTRNRLVLLLEFAKPATPREAFERLHEQWEVDEEDFLKMLAALEENQLLVPVRSQATMMLAKGSFASLQRHHRMLRDTIRVLAYKTAIVRSCVDKVVVEIGCGTGVLSLFAAKAGARRVVAIEESAIARIAERMFKVNGCDRIIELRRGNSRNVQIEERADVIVHEIIGNNPLDENLLLYIRDARRRFLKDGGQLLPHRIEICCIGFEANEDLLFHDRQNLRAKEFAGLYGLDFSPFVDALQDQSVREFPFTLDHGNLERFKPRILSDECKLYDINLYEDSDELVGQKGVTHRELAIHTSGNLSGFILFFRAHLDEVTQLTNSPYVPLTHWGRLVSPLSSETAVKAGTRVAVRASIETIDGAHQVLVDTTS